MKKALSIMICTLLLTCICTAYSFAAETNTKASTGAIQYYSFYLDLPKGGVKDLATARSKASTASYAYYELDTVTNKTGYELYINVRNSSGSTTVGTAAAIPSYVDGTNLDYVKYVYYKSGYGNTGVMYRPSGQTARESTRAAYVDGIWIP